MKKEIYERGDSLAIDNFETNLVASAWLSERKQEKILLSQHITKTGGSVDKQ